MKQVVLPTFFSFPLSQPELATSESNIPLLPEEMLLHIFTICLENQNLQPICQINLTCRQFYRIANHLPYVLWTRFLVELKNVNYRTQEVCIHPALYCSISQYNLKSHSIRLWESLDRQEKGLYTFLHLNFREIIQHSDNLFHTIYQVEKDRFHIIYQVEKDQVLVEKDKFPVTVKFEQNLQKIYQLVDKALTWRKWRVDNLKASAIPDAYIQTIANKCQQQVLLLNHQAFSSRVDMQNSANNLQKILNEGICLRAYSRGSKEIHQLIINQLNANSLTVHVKCNFKTAYQLVKLVEDLNNFQLLLGFLSHSEFFDCEIQLKKLFLYALKKEGFYLPFILKYINRFPQDKRLVYKKLFIRTAFQQNPSTYRILTTDNKALLAED